MPNKRIDIGWLRVFDEAARRGSFSAAATALGTTQPAVSYQIKRIETELGFDLLRRSNVGVELTPEGRLLHEIVSRAVAGIDDLANRTSAGTRLSVRLRTDFAFASHWLVPRMQELRRAFPDLEVEVVATQLHSPEDAADTDVSVIFGSSDHFPAATILLPEKVIPVSASRYADELEQQGNAASLTRARLVHLDAPASAPWLDWRGYLARSGVGDPGEVRGARFNTYSLVVEAAIAGQGVALGWAGLIDAFLSAGLLKAVGPPVSVPDRGYLLIPPKRRTPGNEALVSWLKQTA